MDVEIKPWVKPHLRARLMEEAQAREPKTAQGLTPTTPAQASVGSSTPLAVGMTLVNGDRVRIKRPADPDVGPGWVSQMDALDGGWVTVVTRSGFNGNYPDWFRGVDAARPLSDLWTFSTDWVVEKL